MRLIRTENSIWILRERQHLRLDSNSAETLTDAEILQALPAQRSEVTVNPYSATVAFTTACNLRCPYCFQNTLVSADGKVTRVPSRTLDHAIIPDVVRFIAEKAVNAGTDKCSLSLFGGEPMLAQSVIISLLGALSEKLRIDATLVTNGTLLDPLRVEQMINRGLKTIQVSLDGPRRAHDEMRVTPQGGGSYDSIIQNIRRVERELAGKFQWSFRVNMTPKSVSGIEQLVDDLASIVAAPTAALYFDRVHDTGASSITGLDDRSVVDAIINGYRRARHHSFRIPIPRFSGRSCVTCGEYGGEKGCCIGPTGDLFSCLETIGKPGYKVGDIWEGYEARAKVSTRWKHCGYGSERDLMGHMDRNDEIEGWLLDAHYGYLKENCSR